MFREIIGENKIPPNFLNSILTNPSLYSMFSLEFEENKEYFQGVEKEEYLSEMLKFIEDALFSSNVFHIYGSTEDLDNLTKGKLEYIKKFYDDFLLGAFRDNPENILKTRIFRGLEYAKTSDAYAIKTSEFMSLYDYVFNESIDYTGIVEVLMKDILSALYNGEEISIKEFDILCNYVRNNIYGYVDMDIVMGMLHNHAYKTNHIFDREVAEVLVRSTIKSYLDDFDIPIEVEFVLGLESKEVSEHSFDPNVIRIDYSLIDEFLSLNYVELFERVFYEAEIIKNYTLISENRCDYPTLKVIMGLVSSKVDLDRIFTDESYYPFGYYTDVLSSNFIKTLRFFSMFGVNLIDNYVTSKTRGLESELSIEEEESILSKKEVSLDQRFMLALKHNKNKSSIIKRFAVLKLFFNPDGTRKKASAILKNLVDEELRDVILEYMNSRIIDPEAMIEDVDDLSKYRSKNEYIKTIVETELKYIFVDTFYYSLDSYIKLNRGKLDIEEYLDDLSMKINCIKDTPLTHRFIDEAIFTVSDAKQSS